MVTKDAVSYFLGPLSPQPSNTHSHPDNYCHTHHLTHTLTTPVPPFPLQSPPPPTHTHHTEEVLVTKDAVSYFLGPDGKPCRKSSINW